MENNEWHCQWHEREQTASHSIVSHARGASCDRSPAEDDPVNRALIGGIDLIVVVRVGDLPRFKMLC